MRISLGIVSNRGSGRDELTLDRDVVQEACFRTWRACAQRPGIAPFPVELRVVSAARWDSYATFFSDATGAASGRRAATREGMWT